MGEIMFFSQPFTPEALYEILDAGLTHAAIVSGQLPAEPTETQFDSLATLLGDSFLAVGSSHLSSAATESVEQAVTRGSLGGVPPSVAPDMTVTAVPCTYPLHGPVCSAIDGVNITQGGVGTTAYYPLLKDVALSTTGSEKGRMRFDGISPDNPTPSPYFLPASAFPGWVGESMALMFWFKAVYPGPIVYKFAGASRCWGIGIGSSSIRIDPSSAGGDDVARTISLHLPEAVYFNEGSSPFIWMKSLRCGQCPRFTPSSRPHTRGPVHNLTAPPHRHVALVFDAHANKIHAYLDGKQFAEVYVPHSGRQPGVNHGLHVADLDCFVQNDTFVTFGHAGDQGAHGNFEVQDLRMYTGHVPSDDEISAIANIGREWCVATPTPNLADLFVALRSPFT